MRKSLISISIMVCLVLLGLVGNVYGQIDTVMPDRFLNKDPYKLKINHDYNLDAYKYQNSRYYSSNETRKKRPTNFGYGTGIYYQWAWYGGEISNYISDHKAIFYPIANFDFYFKKSVLQVFILGKGTCTVNSVNINGDNFKGTFYGRAVLINTAVGYEVFENSFFSIIPNLGFHINGHDIYPESQSGVYAGSVNSLIDIETDAFSFGFMADYKILKMNIFDKSYVSIRFKYDYCFTAQQDEYYNGNIQQVTLGLITTFRDKKGRKLNNN